jgi:hypothetical protein
MAGLAGRRCSLTIVTNYALLHGRPVGLFGAAVRNVIMAVPAKKLTVKKVAVTNANTASKSRLTYNRGVTI